jgi:hypothetical protein
MTQYTVEVTYLGLSRRMTTAVVPILAEPEDVLSVIGRMYPTWVEFYFWLPDAPEGKVRMRRSMTGGVGR